METNIEETNLSNLIATTKALLLYCSHDKCNVCKVLRPKVENLIASKFPKIQIEYIDIAKTPRRSAFLQVFAAPTLLIFFEGKEFYRKSRNISIFELEQLLTRPYNLCT